MVKMKANPDDLVYLTDTRKWLGGLKSVHSVFGEPHNENGIVYVTKDHIEQGQFVVQKLLLAEKEMQKEFKNLIQVIFRFKLLFSLTQIVDFIEKVTIINFNCNHYSSL